MVSVILPVLNQIKWTRDCLRTLSENTIIPPEIILIDNGSTDPYKDLVEEFRNLNILYIKNETNIGVNPAWNIGLSFSSKPYVLILNNDTLLNKFFIEKIIDTMKIEDVGICIPIREVRPERLNQINSSEPPRLIDAKYIEGWAFTIRKSIYDKAGPIPSEFKTFMGDTFYFEVSKALGYRNMQMENCTVYHYGSLTVKEICGDYYASHKIENNLWRGMKEKVLTKITTP